MLKSQTGLQILKTWTIVWTSTGLAKILKWTSNFVQGELRQHKPWFVEVLKIIRKDAG
jgi:hypothetical protein